MFPFQSYLVLALTYRFLIHFELTFVYGVRLSSNVSLLHKDIAHDLFIYLIISLNEYAFKV